MVSGSGVAVSCSAGRRCSSDVALLWLWCRLPVTALIRPLAWEPPYVVDMAPQKKEKRERRVIKLVNYYKQFLNALTAEAHQFFPIKVKVV